MTKLPNCPRCGDDELWRVPGKQLQVRCYECGYDSGILAEDKPADADALIAKAIADYGAKGSANEPT